MKKLLLITTVVGLCCAGGLRGQTQIATWSFDDTNSYPYPTTYSATSGTGIIYLNGSNASSAWSSTQLDEYAGTKTNDSRSTQNASNALGLKNSSANGNSMVIKISTKNFIDIIITFATEGSGSGFNFHQWAYSLNGVAFTDFGTNTAKNASGYETRTLDLSAIDALENSENLYLKLTVSGATASGGNNKFDNIVITGTSTLPVTLTSFTAKSIDERILLNWNTASENKNDFFDIQHSADGKNFRSIGELKGAGTSKVNNAYNFIDENPNAGINYYRLVQHDFDGNTSASFVIALNSKIEGSKLNVYAGAEELKIFISSANQTKGELQIYEIGGKQLFSQAIAVNRGHNSISLPFSVDPGVHIVRFTSDSESLVKKFLR